MKIIKFGTITADDEGKICIKNFTFMYENSEEEKIDFNDNKNAGYVFGVVANFLMSKCSPLPPKVDFNIERTVADAIRKAKSSEV